MLALLSIGAMALAATLSLTVGQTRPVEGQPVEITFVGVASDSRCPTGVDCVWAGDAVVDLRVKRDGTPAESLQLHTAEGAGRTARAAGLVVTLDSLEPQPSADQPTAADRYRVGLSISTAQP